MKGKSLPDGAESGELCRVDRKDEGMFQQGGKGSGIAKTGNVNGRMRGPADG